MQTIARTIAEQIDDLADVYRFREPDDIRDYLAGHPNLLPLLREAATKIPQFVPTTRPLELEVFRNPEEEDDTAIVPVVIVDRHGPPMLTEMHRLIREWQIDAGRTVAGRFIVGIEHH